MQYSHFWVYNIGVSGFIKLDEFCHTKSGPGSNYSDQKWTPQAKSGPGLVLDLVRLWDIKSIGLYLLDTCATTKSLGFSAIHITNEIRGHVSATDSLYSQ